METGVQTNYHSECPSCGASSSQWKGYKNWWRIFICTKCDGIFGTCYLSDSYGIVSKYLTQQTSDMEVRYFDFITLGSDGIDRRHGWYDKLTGKLVQVG